MSLVRVYTGPAREVGNTPKVALFLLENVIKFFLCFLPLKQTGGGGKKLNITLKLMVAKFVFALVCLNLIEPDQSIHGINPKR